MIQVNLLLPENLQQGPGNMDSIRRGGPTARTRNTFLRALECSSGHEQWLDSWNPASNKELPVFSRALTPALSSRVFAVIGAETPPPVDYSSTACSNSRAIRKSTEDTCRRQQGDFGLQIIPLGYSR